MKPNKLQNSENKRQKWCGRKKQTTKARDGKKQYITKYLHVIVETSHSNSFLNTSTTRPVAVKLLLPCFPLHHALDRYPQTVSQITCLQVKRNNNTEEKTSYKIQQYIVSKNPTLKININYRLKVKE